MQTITTAELAALGDNVTLIDVREPHEYAEARIPHAVSVPMSELGERLAEVPDDRAAYVVCQGGVRSARVIEALEPHGWGHLVNVEGGTGQWIAEGRPVAHD
ncbi:hypothetical protein GCM10011490_21980 [Pseudoclavibacter endophyticus]|uniref:Rhodanese-like domain-containing protein n=1 Tax=Pseudoclavibacter endophyticus TaxID=1778590 RepID=A0A6H9WQ68_9MICO|nr:rhodanese-like domain-containing protein [Pseudoclavibacter endophyticus]KAB1648241.1 rhodanese-like domain-containing protein [Pseudoclavibacter endophyticus]GGA70927.1 hypothetical protein GCM10011490_21980 [Pseudoclavibacter endophyticus]